VKRAGKILRREREMNKREIKRKRERNRGRVSERGK
jgi:hypothetical protein